jgi:hypothetical protein
MKRLGLLLVLGILVRGSAVSAQTVKAQTIQYLSGSETVSGYFVAPTASGKHPAIIVIPEWWAPTTAGFRRKL